MEGVVQKASAGAEEVVDVENVGGIRNGCEGNTRKQRTNTKKETESEDK